MSVLYLWFSSEYSAYSFAMSIFDPPYFYCAGVILRKSASLAKLQPSNTEGLVWTPNRFAG